MSHSTFTSMKPRQPPADIFGYNNRCENGNFPPGSRTLVCAFPPVPVPVRYMLYVKIKAQRSDGEHQHSFILEKIAAAQGHNPNHSSCNSDVAKAVD